MFFRLVRLRLRDGCLWAFRRHWEEKILPALAATDGCLYAALLQPSGEEGGETCESLTLWESPAHADAYVGSGLYDQLLDEADPWLATATEWKSDLHDRPPLPEPDVATYPVEIARESPGPARGAAVFLRIVDVRLDPSRFEEMRSVFEKTIIPELLVTPGCRAAFLLEGLRGRSQVLSVTLWDDEASAVRYEANGRFDALVAQTRPFLSGLYQWRLSLAPADGSRGVTGADLGVTRYRVLTGRSLRPSGS